MILAYVAVVKIQTLLYEQCFILQTLLSALNINTYYSCVQTHFSIMHKNERNKMFSRITFCYDNLSVDSVFESLWL